MDTQNQLTDSEVLELVELIAPSYPELEEIDDFEEVKKYLLSLTELNLTDRDDLITLPESITKLTQLIELDLYWCENLKTLPESLGNLTQLTKLNLDQCENLKTLPESIGNLKQLTKLHLSECANLTTLPESFGNLTQLTKLNFSGCENLSILPESLGNLTQLTELDFFWCLNLTTLPESLGNLTQLTKLGLNGCKNLETLPESLGNLSQLTELDLSWCENLTTLPESLGNLSQFIFFSLSGCKKLKITTLLKISKSQLDNETLMYIANILHRQGYLQQAKEYYLEIQPEIFIISINGNFIDHYFISQKELVLIYAKEENWNEVTKCFDNIKRTHKEYYVQQVINQIQKIQNNHQKIYLFNIFHSFLNIRKNLLVGRNRNYTYEQTFAHYAKPDVAMILLDEQNKFQIASTEQVNDPKEGKVIFDYFSEKLKGKQINLTPLNKLSTFVGCFTFNHDSLNQFRLYGKEDNKEATGASIVLNADFFSYQHDKTLQSKKQKTDNIDDKNKDKLPLYRCIYLDPEGKLDNQPYIQVACRDKLTFYREKGRNQNDWKKYQEYINDIQENIMKEFSNIEINICELFTNVNSIEGKEQLIETVSFILLPLSFMVKHSAYQEEQECRIFRFVAPDDKEIEVTPASKRMYIEYSQSMSKYVNKMYLSTGAEQYRNIFEFLTKKISNKIEIRKSKNPFR